MARQLSTKRLYQLPPDVTIISSVESGTGLTTTGMYRQKSATREMQVGNPPMIPHGLSGSGRCTQMGKQSVKFLPRNPVQQAMFTN
ncbi:MAG: hypothetical protein LIO96_12445 [Lachnospiraceae bacterium]|nr:hypothetical protein [Lachnospiraceae bacterium]